MTSPSRIGVRRAATAVLACAAQFLVVLDVSLVTVAVPTIAVELGLSALQASWVISAYTVAFASLLLLGGRLCDILGARRAFLLASGLFMAATALGALSGGGELLIAARAVQGGAAALLAPTSLALLQDVDEPTARMRAVAAWSATSSAGGALGALLGGAMLLVWPWPVILLFEGALAFAGLLLALAVIPARRGRFRSVRVDGVGALALSLALAAGVVSVIDAGTVGPTSPSFWIALALVLCSAVVFGLRHRAAPTRSLLAPVLLRTPRIAAANAVMLLAAGSCFPLWFLLSFTLQEALDLTAFETGLWFLVPSAAVVIGSLLVPALRRRLSAFVLVLVAATLACLGALGLALTAAQGSIAAILPASAMAFGMGLVFTTLTTVGTRDLPPESRGAAAGAVNASRQLGGAIGLAVATVTFTGTGGVVAGFLALAVLAAAVLVVAPLLRRPLREEHTSDAAEDRTTQDPVVSG